MTRSRPFEDDQAAALFAVADVLVTKALESMGKRLVRADRSRFGQRNGLPWHEAHTRWTPQEDVVEKSLRGAWDVVPALLDNHGCCGVTSAQVIAMLDSYVRDLGITGTAHTVDELAYRFSTRLGVTVSLVTPLLTGSSS